MATDMERNSLFFGGEPLDETGDLVVKAALHIRVRDFAHPVPAHLFSELHDRYSRHVSDLEENIALILENAREVDKSLVFVLDAPSDDNLIKAQVAKAPAPKKAPKPASSANKKREEVKHPGTRGGKFYRTKNGKIVYGTQPPPGHDASHEATDEEVAEHVAKSLSPTVFLGHNEATLEAMRESGEFDEDDLSTIEIVRNNLLKPELEDLGIDEKAVDADVKIKNAFGEKGNLMAVHDWMQRFFVDNIVAADPERNKKEDVLEMWNDLHEKYQKAIHNPKVAAAMVERAREYEEQVNKYNYDIENSRDDTAPLFQDFVHGENIQDVGLSAILAMRDLGVLFVPRKGQTKRRTKKDTNGSLHLKGTMQPDTEYLNSITTSEETRGRQPRVSLDRMNEAQLSAVYIASVMASSRHDNGDFDVRDSWNDKIRDSAQATKAEQAVKDALIKKLNTTPTEVAHVLSRLHQIGAVVAVSANRFNSGESAGLNKLFDESGDVIKPKDVKKLREELMKAQAEREAILKSQEDVSFSMPSHMKEGFWGKDLVKPDGTKIKPKPFSWQAKAINWIKTVKRGILAYDMGMGKSACVIGATCSLLDKGKIERSIMILPPVLMGQWPNEIRTYAPGIKAEEILDLSPYSLEERKLMLKSDLAKKAKFIIMSSGTLTDPKEGQAGQQAEEEGMDNEFISALNELPNSMVCVDEVHTGGYKSGAEKEENASVRNRLLGQLMKDRDYAIGMTGTPMPNSPMDTFNLVDLFNPGKIGDRDQWSGTLSNTIIDPETGKRTVANPDKLADLRNRLKPYVFTKTVDDDDVAPELKEWLPPPPSQMRHEIKPDIRHGENGLSQRDYFIPDGGVDRIADARLRIIEGRWKTQGKDPMDERTRLLIKRLLRITLERQAAISPALIDPTYGPDSPAPKLDMACDEITQHFKGGWGANGEPVVVFSSQVKAFDLLQRRMRQRGIDTDNQCAVISQDASQEDRAYIQDAVNSGKIKIVMVGIKSGGAGLGLQKAANHMIFLDNPWTPADKRQAIGRVQRVQQKKNVRITSMSMEGTYDPVIEEKIAKKQVVSDALLGDDDTWEDDAQDKIRAILGGVSPDEQKHQNKKRFTEEHDQNFADIAAMMKPGEDLAAALLADRNLTDVEVNKKARAELGPHLTHEFDKHKDRKAWREKRAEERLGSRVAGIEALIKVMKTQHNKKDPKVEQKIERLTSRLKFLKRAGKPIPTPAPGDRPPGVDEKKAPKAEKKPAKKKAGAKK